MERDNAPLCSLHYDGQDMETTSVSIDEWMDKDGFDIYTYIFICIYLSIVRYGSRYTHKMGHYSPIKNNEILPFVTTWMNLENSMLTKICHTEKNKYPMISFICGT